MAFARGVDHLDGDERSLPALVVPRPNVSFVYRVKDDRLAAEGICRGDLLVIERGQQLEAGRIALITVEGHYALARVLKKDGRFTFAEMPGDGSDVELFGIASRVVQFLIP
jgi:SOS-response transcriptional repressor LexA